MCGIVGFYSPDKCWSENDLRAGVSALEHRGRDNSDIELFEGGKVGLGHQRLSILGLHPNSNQPFHSSTGTHVVSFNGEIYNYEELASQFGVNNVTGCDTEVVTELLALQGVDAIQHFNGMFAIAQYGVNDQILTLIRDRIGIKPLFYYWDGRNLAFASETKALLSMGIPKVIDKNALGHYLALEYIPGELSIIQGVKKLEPGNYLQVRDGKLHIQEYYNLLAGIEGSNERPLKAEDLEQLEAAIAESVRLRVRSDVPLGALLSGGVDSSVVCQAATKQISGKLNTYCMGFDESAFDESTFAASVAGVLETNHHKYTMRKGDFDNVIENVVKAYDEPFASSSSLPSYEICRFLRSDLKVALSGDGGDELFMGYGYYDWLHRLEVIRKRFGKMGLRIASRMLSLGRYRERRASRIFQSYGENCEWPLAWGQEHEMFLDKEINELIGPHFNPEKLLKKWAGINKLSIEQKLKVSLFDLLEYLPNNLLYKLDAASMHNNLEVRVPLLDHGIVELALRLPTAAKRNSTESKILLKQLLRKHLPRELVDRKKWGFPAPISTWVRDNIDEIDTRWLTHERLGKIGIEIDPVKRLISKYKNGQHIHYKRIWSLYILCRWYDSHIAQD